MRGAARATVATAVGGALLALLAFPAPAAARSGDFTVKCINGRCKGKKIGIRSFKRKVLYLTFWATWCKPCKAELKQLRKFYKKHRKKGLEVLAISVDEPLSRARVLPLVKRYKLPFPVAIDKSGQVVRIFNPKRTVPYSLLFDRKGKIRKRRVSFQISDFPAIRKEILEELKRK